MRSMLRNQNVKCQAAMKRRWRRLLRDSLKFKSICSSDARVCVWESLYVNRRHFIISCGELLHANHMSMACARPRACVCAWHGFVKFAEGKLWCSLQRWATTPTVTRSTQYRSACMTRQDCDEIVLGGEPYILFSSVCMLSANEVNTDYH